MSDDELDQLDDIIARLKEQSKNATWLMRHNHELRQENLKLVEALPNDDKASLRRRVAELEEQNAALGVRIDGMVKRLAEVHPASARPITVRKAGGK
jgi:hypothetical protein